MTINTFLWIRGSSVNTVIRERHGRLGFDSRQKQQCYVFATAPSPAREPTQPLPNGYRRHSGRCVKFSTHLHQATKLRMRGAIPPLGV